MILRMEMVLSNILNVLLAERKLFMVFRLLLKINFSQQGHISQL